jgi:hypothetical protein
MRPIIYFCCMIHDTLQWISTLHFSFPRIVYEGLWSWVSPEHVRACWRDTCTCLLPKLYQPVKWGTRVKMGSKDSAVEIGIYKVIFCVMMSCVDWHCLCNHLWHIVIMKNRLYAFFILLASLCFSYTRFFVILPPSPPTTSEGLSWF